MDSWGGGTYDTDRDQLIVWGGGHTNCSGNEVYAFGPLTAATPTWKRLTNPSNPPAMNTNYAPDGRPTTRHTQDSIAYMSGWGSRPSHNKMMNCVATGFWPNGYTGTQGDLFDFTVNGFTGEPWSRTALPPATVFPGATCVFNPVTNRVWYHTVGGYYNNGVYQAPGLSEYNPDTNTWTPRARYDVYSNESGTVDTTRNLLAVIQPAAAGAGQTGGVRIHYLNTPDSVPNTPDSNSQPFLQILQAPLIPNRLMVRALFTIR